MRTVTRGSPSVDGMTTVTVAVPTHKLHAYKQVALDNLQEFQFTAGELRGSMTGEQR